MSIRYVEMIVGIFMFMGLLGLLILAYKVSDFSSPALTDTYTVQAEFEDIGNLKVRSPVKMAGVKIGEISDIVLDGASYRAVVSMRIDGRHDRIPTDSSARILTAGLLGSNYISITPGYGEEELHYLQKDDRINDTYSAIILENLIGKFLFNLEKGNKK